MLRFFFILLYFYLITSVKASDDNNLSFIQQLLKWNIDYKKLNNFKAGAICIDENDIRYPALGFSFQLADINYAKKIALEGCMQMKRKNKILSSCKCEIIYENNKFIGGK